MPDTPGDVPSGRESSIGVRYLPPQSMIRSAVPVQAQHDLDRVLGRELTNQDTSAS
jgi:hypothetical protein